MSSSQRTTREAEGARPARPVALASRSVAPVATAQGPMPAGAVLGNRYRVEDRIGAGGMATIYRGYDLTLERPVAIKVLHSHLVGDAELQARFRTEARHAASLSHPHIVAVFDQGVAALPYIVMELIDGPSLREVLNEHGRLPPSQALAIIEPVARALDRAHRGGVVHRDIKPENVLVAPDGTPKVADFGIARLVAGTSHTQTGSLIGSVHYMAPELVDGADASPASDGYALGVLLYELLTGERPFAGDTPMAVALRHTRDRVPAPSTVGVDCGTDVDAVVLRATAHDPDTRYPDLRTLADELRGAVPGGAKEVEVRGAHDGQTLVIPAEAQETAPVAAQQEVAGRRRPARTSAPDTGRGPGGNGRRPRDRGGEAAGDRPASDHASRPAATSAPPPAGRDGRRRGTPGQGTARPRRLKRILVALVLTCLLLVAAAGGAYAWWHYVVAPVTPAPGLVGLMEDEAFETTTDLGLGLTVEALRYDFAAPEGEVLAQAPDPDTELRRGDDVSVVLSRGPEPVEMPSVVGDVEADAVAALEAERLDVTVGTEYHDDVPEGEVISQDPEAGATLRQGDAASLTVSLGIEQVTIPSLVGRDQNEIEAVLSEADLALGDIGRAWSDDVPAEGEVIDQSHEPEATVDKGTSVDVTVSLGPLTIEVPDVRGEAVEDARAALEGRSLGVEVVTERRPRLGPFVRGSVGVVEEQLPGGGEAIQRGETVTLYTFGD